MSPASKSKSKDKKSGKEHQKASQAGGGGIPTSGYNPLLGTFHTLETAPVHSPQPPHVNGRFRNIDETDDHSGSLFGNGVEYDAVSNHDSWSGESEDHKDKTGQPHAIPGSDIDKREKIRQKNEKKHQRQREKRAQELHERCSGYLMSRKLESLAQQLVAMGFSSEQATLALILNEGRVEESVVWLLEGNKDETDKQRHLDGRGGNLKIDISEELARVKEMEIRFKCSTQEVERAIVACEGDLLKATETLKAQKPKPEETDKLLQAVSQNPSWAPPKPALSTAIQHKRDEKDFNYTKNAVTVGPPSSYMEFGGKNVVQSINKVQPKLEWAKPSEKSWPIAGPTVSPLQGPLLTVKTETHLLGVRREIKNLQLGSVREPVTLMQRPQSGNTKQIGTTNVGPSSPTGTNGPKSRGSNNQLYNSQFQYQQQQNLWTRTTGMSPTLTAATSLGLFSRLGSNGSSGPTSPLGWNDSGSMLHFDYTTVDWSLDPIVRASLSRRSGVNLNSPFMQNNNHHNHPLYDSYNTTSGRPNVKPPVSSGGGDTGGGEWASPFEEKDLFNLQRQLVYSPSL